ncbi:MAG: rhomboid family intramembrane serine protease [Flavobacterium sp. BFFFF2]|nr:MAG: rhomboid family intramembrane serine protease [Flavobacterium sp. BFFFF2]
MIRITETVKHLLIINTLLFILSISGLLPITKLFPLWLPDNPLFKPWQLVTYMFMHGGWMHLLFNMMALYSFGSTLEYSWGTKKFLFFYLSCGIGAALLHIGISHWEYQSVVDAMRLIPVFDTDIQLFLTEGRYNSQILESVPLSKLESLYSVYNSPTVGASGAIYGLLIAFAMMFPDAELALLFIPFPIKARYFVPGLLGLDLFLGLKGQSLFGSGGTGVAHFAHLGGALVGFIIIWYWKKNQFNNKRWN